MNEDKATRYHRLARIARLTSVGVSGALLAALVATGGSRALANLSAGVSSAMGGAPPAPALTVAIYALALGLLSEIVTLPAAYFRGYVLERRYDLSRESARRWAIDHAKAAAIGLLFAIVVTELVYFTIRLWPRAWWLAAGAALALLTLGLTRLAPVLLLPIFYRFTPLTRDALRQRLEALAARAGTSIVGVYEWKLGDKTSKANAALAGMGATRRILLSDTLLDAYSDEEIEVVLAHELSHHVHRDLWRGFAFEAAFTFAALFAGDRALVALGPRLGVGHPADVAGLPLLVLAAAGVSLAAMPLANAFSRAHEYRADRFALDLTRNAPAFVSAMRKLGSQNLAEERPSRLVEVLFYTHPPMARRISAARAWADRQARPGPTGGFAERPA